LLENAIKHNIITKTKPLHINVCIREGKLQICNNIQMRPHAEDKADVGLRNVRFSYESITVIPMMVTTDDENFTVALPLIKELSRTA
jgi:LytS/YehU family sensor histidine kinase